MYDGIETLVLDLIDVNRCIPGGVQRGGADTVADLGRQRVHLIAHQSFLIRRCRQSELARVATEFVPQCRQQRMPIHTEGILRRPQLLNDLQPRIAAAGLDGKQAAARRQTAGQRRQHLLRLEFGRHARAPGL